MSGQVLFAAVVPPPEVVAALSAELGRYPRDRRLRWMSPEQWHITLAFFGVDEPGARVAWLRQRLRDVPAPLVRLAGAGSFSGVLWMGALGDRLLALAEAAGAGTEQHPYRAHLTLARGRSPASIAGWVRRLADYRGPSWTAGEVVLMHSDRRADGPHYTPVQRFGLTAGREV